MRTETILDGAGQGRPPEPDTAWRKRTPAGTLVLGVVTMPLIAGAPASAQSPGAAELGWLAGCWEQRSAASALVIEEFWTEPRGGTLLGLSRTTRDGVFAGFEFMRIFERDGALIFAAQPSGRAPTEFVAAPTAANEREIVFENAGNDFPQRVRYRAVGTDSLLARIEGTSNGQDAAVDFPYGRAYCDGR